MKTKKANNSQTKFEIDIFTEKLAKLLLEQATTDKK